MFQYWENAVGADGTPVRRRKAIKLAEYSDQYRSKKDLAAKVADILHDINAHRGKPASDVTLQDFIERDYLPNVRQTKQPSTLKGYTDIYEDHVKQRVGGLRLREFRTVEGQRILDSIAQANPEMTHVSLLHIKSFLSGVFSYARRVGSLDGANPIQGRGAVIVAGSRSAPTYAYSLPEIETIIDSVENVTHRTLVTVAAFTGLSLSELRGLKWEDVDFKAKTITVNRKYWRTHEGQTKTEARQAPVPMIGPVRIALRAHRKANPSTTYVFEGPFQKPLDIATIGTKRVKPVIKVEWYGWHAFRRGLATNLHELGVEDMEIQAILRHSNVATTQKSYIKSRAAAGVAAMKRLENKVSR
jgi:integrase